MLWNTLLHFDHPHGTATFAGCQMRYLIVSSHGVLGAFGFSASALHLRARDAWMAWSEGQRRAHLHRVVCLSRFLIRPGVRCRHLASHVLGGVLRRLPADFEARYHYRPWLVETFVEPDQDGTSFKAANFVFVGRTAGRGRQDRDKDRARTVKSVYMYELAPHWRQRLGVSFVDAAPSLSPGEGLDSGRVGGERVWRGTLGRSTVVGASGEERGIAGVVSGPRDHRQSEPRPGGGEGLLPVDREAGRVGGDAWEHSGAAPRARHPADARPGGGSMHPGRDRPQLRDAPRVRGSGHHRAQPDEVENARAASASDPGGDRRGGASGRAALRFRRAARQRTGRW